MKPAAGYKFPRPVEGLDLRAAQNPHSRWSTCFSSASRALRTALTCAARAHGFKMIILWILDEGLRRCTAFNRTASTHTRRIPWQGHVHPDLLLKGQHPNCLNKGKGGCDSRLNASHRRISGRLGQNARHLNLGLDMEVEHEQYARGIPFEYQQ